MLDLKVMRGIEKERDQRERERERERANEYFMIRTRFEYMCAHEYNTPVFWFHD